MEISIIALDPIEPECNYGIRIMSSCLKQKGHSINMIFLSVAKYDSLYSKEVLKQLIKIVKNSDIIGISSMSISLRRGIQVIKALKRLNKPIAWGGIHATISPDQCIKYADIVCVGEGEEAMSELVETMNKGKDYYHVQNFWFKKGKQIIRNPVRPLIQDLDSLPLPDYDYNTHWILDKNKIVKANKYYKEVGTITIHTIRGCPHNCTYCCNNLISNIYRGKGNLIRKKSINTVVNDLKKLKKILPSLRRVLLTDDVFFIRPVSEMELFYKKYKKEVNMPFQCYASPTILTEEKLRLLLKTGLDKVEMGIQTGSEDLNINLYKRNILNSSVLRAARIINKYKTKMKPPNYQIIYHNPYEKEKDVIETIKLIQQLPPPFTLQTFILQFFPGTGLYKKAKKDNLIEKDNLFVEFNDIQKKFKSNKEENYLHSLIYLMSGPVRTHTIGAIPRKLVPTLIKTKNINYLKKRGRLMRFIIIIVKSVRNLFRHFFRARIRVLKIYSKITGSA